MGFQEEVATNNFETHGRPAPPPADILVVDDEPNIRFILDEALTRDGHRVTTAGSGQAALDLLALRHFDLILLDLRLTDMSGADVLAALRRLSPDTIAIMLTAHGSLESAVIALRQGAHDYLFKPCQPEQIRESVRSGLLKRRAVSPPPGPEPARNSTERPNSAAGSDRFLIRGGLIVDSIRHVITLDGNLCDASPTEFRLLALLARAAPRVVPPQELVRDALGYATDSGEASEVVRFHIHRLRQKLRAASSGRENMLKNVRGIGYSLDIE